MARLVPVTERGHRIGENHPRAKHSDATIRRIRDLHELEHMSYSRIAAQLGVPLETVRNVCVYRSREQVPYDWKRIR